MVYWSAAYLWKHCKKFTKCRDETRCNYNLTSSTQWALTEGTAEPVLVEQKCTNNAMIPLVLKAPRKLYMKSIKISSATLWLTAVL